MFQRNINARDYLEIFLVSAVTSLLSIRFYLSLTNYPELGNTHFHIAHLLFGGLMMLAAIVLSLAFLGGRISKLSSIIGGAGFGVFIDELGKFITKDNNYFYQPAIGIIYAIFMILYIIFNYLSRKTVYTPIEKELNGLALLGEYATGNIDERRRAQLIEILDNASEQTILSRLKPLVVEIKDISVTEPSLFIRWRLSISRFYNCLAARRQTNSLIAALFILQALVFIGLVVLNLWINLDSAADSILLYKTIYGQVLMIGQFMSAMIAGLFVLIGVYRLARSRKKAYESFHTAILINLLLTEFFIFSRIQFSALPGFFFNLILLILLRAAQSEEAGIRHR